jgi:hypothetical protein
MPAKSTASKKAKGRRLQQYVRQVILENFTVLEEDDVRSTSMGASGMDVLLSPKAQGVFPFAIECKNQEKLNFWDSIEQASKNSTEKLKPLLVFKRNSSKVYCILELDHLIKLLK